MKWWPVIEDMFNSPQIKQLHDDMSSFLCSRDEHKYTFIDAKIKCRVSSMGQASWRSNFAIRNEGPFFDDSARQYWRCVVNVCNSAGESTE